MSNPKQSTIPHIEVSDPAEAFRKLEDFTRRVLAVPKKEIDRKLATDKKNRQYKKRS